MQDETWRGGGGADPGGMVPNFFLGIFLFFFILNLKILSI